MNLQHCANIRGADPASVAACKKVMDDLSSLNNRVGEFLQTEQVKMVRTGDLLTGRVDSPVAIYMDTNCGAPTRCTAIRSPTPK
jgi:hypothetical protein